jgi:hypothetical protein
MDENTVSSSDPRTKLEILHVYVWAYDLKLGTETKANLKSTEACCI